MNDMVKEVFVAIRANTSATVAEAEAATRAAILAVLDYFSEPGNVTREMINRRQGGYGSTEGLMEDAERNGIAAAMRAARDEVSRDSSGR